jgi:hypothetical protein
LRPSKYIRPRQILRFTPLATGKVENASVHKTPFLFNRGMGFFIAMKERGGVYGRGGEGERLFFFME